MDAVASSDILVEGFHALVPDGWYEAKFVGHDTARLFNTPKVILKFEITQLDPHLGTKLFRPFRAREVFKPLGRGGRFTLHARSELYMTIVRLLDLKLRPDRVSLHDLRHMPLRVRTRTVTTDSRQTATPPELYYSVIGEIADGR